MDNILELINRRQRQILVHSFIYYKLNDSIISDHTFDQWAKELANLMEEYKELAKKSAHYEAFKDFDGTTGYNLPYSHPYIQNTGLRLLRFHKYLNNTPL